MSTVRLGDKTFELYIPGEKIREAVLRIARQISTDYEGKKPLFLAVLNGSFLFAADLVREIRTDCEISFVKLASYSGTGSTGTMKELIGLNENFAGRHVIILEDIVDTGNTLAHLIEKVSALQPASVRIATLLFKPGAYKKEIPVDYAGLNIPNDFIVGYGLDYDGLGRNLKDIFKIREK